MNWLLLIFFPWRDIILRWNITSEPRVGITNTGRTYSILSISNTLTGSHSTRSILILWRLTSPFIGTLSHQRVKNGTARCRKIFCSLSKYQSILPIQRGWRLTLIPLNVLLKASGVWEKRPGLFWYNFRQSLRLMSRWCVIFSLFSTESYVILWRQEINLSLMIDSLSFWKKTTLRGALQTAQDGFLTMRLSQPHLSTYDSMVHKGSMHLTTAMKNLRYGRTKSLTGTEIFLYTSITIFMATQ